MKIKKIVTSLALSVTLLGGLTQTISTTRANVLDDVASLFTGNEDAALVATKASDGFYDITLNLDLTSNRTFKLVFTGNIINSELFEGGLSKQEQGGVVTLHKYNPDDGLHSISFDVGGEATSIQLKGQALPQSKGDLILYDGVGQEINKVELTGSLPRQTRNTITGADVLWTRETALANYSDSAATNSKYIPATDAEIAQRNAVANAKYGFNPEANVQYVDTWAKFVAAWENENVTKIVLQTDIDTPSVSNTNLWTSDTSTDAREKSIEIDGQGHKLYIGHQSLQTKTNISGTALLHIHDIMLQQNNSFGYSEAGYYWSFINGYGGTDENYGTVTSSTERGLHWALRMGNVSTYHDKNSGTENATNNHTTVSRVARLNSGEVTLYGVVNFQTLSEAFYLGSLVLEDGTYYQHRTTHFNYSTDWFINHSPANSTGKSKELTIGKNAFVYAKNMTSGESYPAFFNHYGRITVGEESIFNASMMGRAIFFEDEGQEFIAEKNATVNLLSRGDGSVVGYGSNTHGDSLAGIGDNSKFETKDGVSLFIYGNTADGLINFVQKGVLGVANPNIHNASFIVTNPKLVDLKNKYNSSTTGTNRVFNLKSGLGNRIIINDSDISLWNNATALTADPDKDDILVDYFGFNDRDNNIAASSTLSTAGVTWQNFRRLYAGNMPPEVQWHYDKGSGTVNHITDADKTITARIQTGWIAEDKFDANGNAVLRPVYAKKDQVTANLLNSEYVSATQVKTDANGYVSWSASDFQTAGTVLQIDAYRKTPEQWRTDLNNPTTKTVVLDVTPPLPATIDGNKVTNASKTITGDNAEPGANIFIVINGVETQVGTVATDGTWSYTLPSYLNPGDKVTIYLEDNSGQLPTNMNPAAPTTNNAVGNINPNADMTYRDTTFKKAPSWIVEDVIPVNQTKKTVDSVTNEQGNAKTNTGAQELWTGDSLIYTLTVKNNATSGLTTKLANVVLSDVLPNDVKFTHDSSDIKLNGVSLDEANYTYDPLTRLLTVPAGDLNTGDVATVTFKVKVLKSAIGTEILNTLNTVGDSPRIGEKLSGTDNAKTGIVKDGGSLELLSVPNLNFGMSNLLSAVTIGTTYFGTPEAGQSLKVKDSRVHDEVGWHLSVAMIEPFKTASGDVNNQDVLIYKNGANDLVVNNLAQKIYEVSTSTTTEEFNISSANWANGGDGFYLKNKGFTKFTTYTSKLEWTLTTEPDE